LLTLAAPPDPGSAYGLQKRRCRELLAASKYDTRFAVIPGVLHDQAEWGGGTTEYALELLKAFHEAHADGRAPVTWHCPVRAASVLPMIHSDDLIAGLVALTDAASEALHEPQNGYAFAGFSFAARDLVQVLQRRLQLERGDSDSAVSQQSPQQQDETESVIGNLRVVYPPAAADGAAVRFAEMWPDSISGAAAWRDLAWTPEHAASLDVVARRILDAHASRNALK
jgi:threonine 3-dehydrogenase